MQIGAFRFPRQALGIMLAVVTLPVYAQRSLTVSSPDKSVTLSLRVADSVYYSVAVNNKAVVSWSAVALVTNAGSFGARSRLVKQSRAAVADTIVNNVPHKRRLIPNQYNSLTLSFRERFSIEWRVFNDGIAYRFSTTHADSLTIANEVATFRFSQPAKGYIPVVQPRDNADVYHSGFEELYTHMPLSDFKRTQRAFSPVLVDDGSVKVLVTESDLLRYPGMFLQGTGGNSLRGEFAPYAAQEMVKGDEFKQWIVTQRAPYIAKAAGTRTFPWRVVALAKTDGDLVMNDIVYRLATPATPGDWSWVTPGICTDEWICGINLRGLDFKPGINTETYKHYIDFASRFGMQYVMLDAGWSSNDDLFKITPGIDLEAITAYAKTKNIRIFLWTLAMTLDRQLEPALTEFNRLGIAGFNTDFMDRDDQKTVQFYERIAAAAARHKLMVMFHGAFKNAGFERTFPNAITREGILGSEYNIWSDKASPEHDLLIPFIRMAAGPLDYEPGFYLNANARTFKPLPDLVMSQGTRCHQLAMFVVYESPLQVFSGNPSDAWPEIAYTTYLASLPTTWDETRVLHAAVGDYVVIARRKDNDWYIGAMTDWTPRELTVDLSFLNKGQYRAFTVEDGPNAAKNGSDYRMGYALVDAQTKVTLRLAPGGGYVAKLIKLYDARP